MQISVIIPVFNAAAFVEKAVESALMQPETGEVILIEDGSTDNSLKICKKLVDENDNVFLFQHVDKMNHGAGASRNIGILKAKYEYLSFLDADDFYNDNSFIRAIQILTNHPEIDAVHSRCDNYANNNDEFEEWYIEESGGEVDVYFFSAAEDPMMLFADYLRGDKGYFYLYSLVLRKSSVPNIGLFDESLLMSQDVDFVWRLLSKCKVVAGEISRPTVYRRIHQNNSVKNIEKLNYYVTKVTSKWIDKLKERSYNREVHWLFVRIYLEYYCKVKKVRNKRLKKLLLLARLFINKPFLFERLILI